MNTLNASQTQSNPNEHFQNKYPYKCCRCGFCCLLISCKISQQVFGIKPSDKCPALIFDGDKAVCKLAESKTISPLLGIGYGCDILATAIIDGEKYDYSGLPENEKRRFASKRKSNSLFVIETEKAKKAKYGT